MSPENTRDTHVTVSDERLEVMRRWADSWNRVDLDAFADLFDANAELITDPSWMEAGPVRGRAAIMGWYEGLKESWEGRDVVAIRELFEVKDKVVARFLWQVRGRTSGIEMDLDATSINNLKQGRIVRQQWYFDHVQALKAVGLAE
jgi:ketosteroid isomerase-like protein